MACPSIGTAGQEGRALRRLSGLILLEPGVHPRRAFSSVGRKKGDRVTPIALSKPARDAPPGGRKAAAARALQWSRDFLPLTETETALSTFSSIFSSGCLETSAISLTMR